MRRPSRVLAKKLLRDLWSRKGSVLALVVIMMVGVGCYVGMAGVWRDMDGSRRRYYAEQRLADFSVDLKRAPAWAVEALVDLPNVRSAQGRVSLAVLIDLPGRREPVSGQVISLPESRGAVLNDILLRSGSYFSGGDKREVILNESFARTNGLQPGSRIKVLLLDQQHELLVVGTAMSPEFVYVLPPDGGFAPDPARFGVMYCTEQFLQRSCDLEGAFNQVVGMVHDDSAGAVMTALEAIERRLDAFGVANKTPREQQPSVRYLGDELVGLRKSSQIMPTIFLGVAALVLNILVSRIVAQQRTVIGTLKALGYSTGTVRRHYFLLGGTVGALGGLAGIWLGGVFQRWLVEVYREFFALPRVEAHRYGDILWTGMAISVGFAILGTLRGVRRAVRLTPAEAMRPPAGKVGRKIPLERIAFVWRRLSFRWKMVLRAVCRNPFRSSVTVVASIVSTALVLSALTMMDSLDYLIAHEFESVSRQDVTVTLRNPRGMEASIEVAGLEGVSGTEAQLVVTCELERGPYRKRLGLTGLTRGSLLYRPLDMEGRPIVVPEEGIVLTEKVGELLHARPGDTVRVRPLVGRRVETQAPVVGLARTYLGLGAYADVGYLSRLIGEERSTNVVVGKFTGGSAGDAFLSQLKERPAVVGVGERRRALAQMDETFSKNQGTMLGAMVLFAGVIAFGSVLNAALVSLSEREREVATLRVLGYTARQSAAIFAWESFLLNAVGITGGLAAGVGLAHLMSWAYDTELYRFPVVIHGTRLVTSAALMVAFIAAAQLVIYAIIRGLPWLDLVKTRE